MRKSELIEGCCYVVDLNATEQLVRLTSIHLLSGWNVMVLNTGRSYSRLPSQKFIRQVEVKYVDGKYVEKEA